MTTITKDTRYISAKGYRVDYSTQQDGKITIYDPEGVVVASCYTTNINHNQNPILKELEKLFLISHYKNPRAAVNPVCNTINDIYKELTRKSLVAIATDTNYKHTRTVKYQDLWVICQMNYYPQTKLLTRSYEFRKPQNEWLRNAIRSSDYRKDTMISKIESELTLQIAVHANEFEEMPTFEETVAKHQKMIDFFYAP